MNMSHFLPTLQEWIFSRQLLHFSALLPQYLEGLTMQNQNRQRDMTQHTEATSCPCEFTLRLSQGFSFQYCSLVCGSHSYSLAHQIGRKQDTDTMKEGKCFTLLWPILICYSPCVYLSVAHAWALDTQVLDVLSCPSCSGRDSYA